MDSSGEDLHKFHEIIKLSTKIEDGAPTRYHLNQNAVDKYEPYTKITYGERVTNKSHKTILMVGESGTGKTTLINTLVNYLLGVQREDRVWFEITDDQSDRKQTCSQTTSITVYGFYLQEGTIDLTIIDTPGYGNTYAKNENEIAMSLLKLSEIDDWFTEVDAVCLVIKATQNRISPIHVYVFDAIQSLFGSDVVENIVLLVTFSHGAHPKNVLMAVKEAKFQCAVNYENQPMFFLFDNCQGETFHERFKMIQEQSCNLSSEGMNGFFKFLENKKPKPLQMTQYVLKQREQLEENISEIKSHIEKINSIENTETEVTYKEKVNIDYSVAKAATCCTVCEENCHYPGCWWVKDISWCSMMKNDHCTVCTNKCHYSTHVKEDKIYVTKKKNMTNKELLNQNDFKIVDSVPLIKEMIEELQKLKSQKMRLVIDAFYCIKTLEMIALNTDSLITLLHIDFLIDELKDIQEPEKAETLENIKERAGEEKHKVLEYITMYYK